MIPLIVLFIGKLEYSSYIFKFTIADINVTEEKPLKTCVFGDKFSRACLQDARLLEHEPGSYYFRVIFPEIYFWKISALLYVGK